jgi:hypothetical protein
MAGFCKITLVGEYYSQKIVNVLRYRSAEWLPFQGNPFDDMRNVLDAVLTEVKATFLGLLNPNYTLLRAEGVGYDDAYNIVTGAPVIRDIGDAGTLAQAETSGAIISAALHLQVGPQESINGIGISKRNRGYLAIGPVPEYYTDNYGHLATAYRTLLDNFAQKLDNQIVMLSPAITLIPIRIHEKWALGVLVLRTYSDVLGYAVPRKFGTRKSRGVEA